jgi:hypothetical protein
MQALHVRTMPLRQPVVSGKDTETIGNMLLAQAGCFGRQRRGMERLQRQLYVQISEMPALARPGCYSRKPLVLDHADRFTESPSVEETFINVSRLQL